MKESEIKKRIELIRTRLIREIGIQEININDEYCRYGTISKMGYQSLDFVPVFYNSYSKEFDCDWSILLRFNLIENVLSSIQTETRSLIVSTCDARSIYAWPELKDSCFYRHRLNFKITEEGLNEFERVSKGLLKDRLFKFAMRMKDIYFINEFFNSEINSDKLLCLHGNHLQGFKRVIISKLAGGKFMDNAMSALDLVYKEGMSILESGEENKLFAEVVSLYPQFNKMILQLEPLNNPDLFSEDNLKYLNT